MRIPRGVENYRHIPTVITHAMLDTSNQCVPGPVRPLVDNPWYLHLMRLRAAALRDLRSGARPERALMRSLSEIKYRLRLLEMGAELSEGDRADAMFFAVHRIRPGTAAWKFSPD